MRLDLYLTHNFNIQSRNKASELIKDNKISGVLSEYMKIIEDKSGLKFKLIKSNSWKDVLAKFKNGKINFIFFRNLFCNFYKFFNFIS